MKRRYGLALTGLVAALTCWLPWTASDARASGSITGELHGIAGRGDVVDVSRATVYFLDATNAVIRGSVVSDGTGAFDSGPLPAGSYRIRIADAFGVNISFRPQYYGSDPSQDAFDLGAAITLADGQVQALSPITLAEQTPVETVVCSASVSGVVTDAATGAVLTGIVVSAVNSINAMPITQAVTDAGYRLSYYGVCVLPKIRFSDPGGRYLPEYSGAGGADDFSLGAVIDWREARGTSVEVNESLAALSPAQAVQNVALQVMILGLASDTSLTSGLDAAVRLVTDANPNNDKASCNILDSFIQRVMARLNSGSLAQSDADVLIQSAQAAKASIGCL